MSSIGMKRQSGLGFAEALAVLPEILKEEGFGIITEIDMRETLKKKIGVELRPYKILGACNPHLAHEALMQDLNLGILLPCNIVVYEGDDGRAVVTAVDPVAATAHLQSPALSSLANKVKAKLETVLDKLA
jgi:uncharacterized protein (DUF302 family)